MNPMMQPNFMDKSWKIALWIIIIDRLLKIPLRLFRPYLVKNLEMASLIAFVLFLVSIIIVGFLYSKYVNRSIEKKIRVRVGLYVALYGFIMALLVKRILFQLNVDPPGVYLILETFTFAITFGLVYTLLNFGSKLASKD